MNKQQYYRHLAIQKLFWNPIGFQVLQLFRSLERRVENVAFNRSIHSDTNGEHWLLSCLPEKAVIVDIGFYQGDFTQMALKIRPKSHVLSIDPARSAATYYQKKFGNDPRVSFYSAAIAEQSGTQTFYDYGNMSSSLEVRSDMHPGELPIETYDVEVVPVDEIAHRAGVDHIDLLKIDAEGFDFHCLCGAASLMRQNSIGLVMFEYANGWICSRRFLRDAAELLKSVNYGLYRLFNGFIVPVSYDSDQERFDLATMYVAMSNSNPLPSVRVRHSKPLRA
jgi:FkbM family methyltransferase